MDRSNEKSTPKGSLSIHDEPIGINERRLLMKIDLRVLPILCAMYLFAFLDRVNIGNAQVFGLSTELGLRGVEYNVALCIFFVPYIIFELPSNIMLKKVKPHVVLSVCMFLFGVTTVAQGFVKSYSGLSPPHILSIVRFTFFFLSTALAGAFGGLLASGIGKMDGIHGYLAWRWIFILEGIMTCGIAVLCYFLVPDFPEDVTWLSEEERRFVQQRLREDVGGSGRAKKVTAKDLLIIFTDYKFIVGAFMYFGFMVSAYGFSYFAPTIIKSWKFNAIQTQLRTVPVWVVAFVMAMIFATFSDRVKHRFAFILGAVAVSAVGYIMLLCVHSNTPVQYFALFLALGGTLSAMPISVCWFNTNLAGHNRRSIGSAFQIAFGNLGGILSTFIFLTKDAPEYVMGYSVALACLAISLISAVIYFVGITRENSRRERNLAGLEDSEGEDLGDLARSFRYLR
ncbi:hypothetical protein RUND412_006171 [Rhizina undulata]